MKKVITLSLVLLICLYIVYTFIAITMNYEGIYQKFNEKIADAGYEVKTDSIEVVHFPIPYVVLGNISISNIFSAKRLEIKFSLPSILMFKPSIKDIVVTDVNITLSGNRGSFAKHGSSVLELVNLVSKLPELKMYNISVIDQDTHNIDTARTLSINPTSSFNQIIVNWDDRTNTRLTYDTHKEDTKVKITATGQYYNFELDEIYKGNKLLSGDLKYNILNLNQYVASRYQDLDLLITKIQSPEPVDMSCKIKALEDKIAVTDIVVKSESISASGNAEIVKSSFPDKLNLDVEFLNLNKLLAAPNMDIVKESKAKNKLKLADLRSVIDIGVKKIIFADGELNDVKFNASSDGTQLNINSCFGNIMNDGKFSLSGNVTQNQYRSLFNGAIAITHKDANILLSKLGYAALATKTPANLTLTSMVKATPIDYQLHDLFMQIGSVNADGSMSIKFIGDTPRINLALDVSSIDVSSPDYPVISHGLSYFYSLADEMKSKDYLKKYIPLRSVNYLGNFDLIFKDVKAKDKMIDKFHVVSDITSGNIVLNSLYYQEGPNYFTGTGYLIASGIKPEFAITVGDAEFFTEGINIHNTLGALQQLRDIYDLTKVSINTDIQVKNWEQGKEAFKNISLSAKNDGVLWAIKSLGMSYNDGTFTSSGSLRVDPMTVNLSYAYNNFNISQLAKIFPVAVFGLEAGGVSANGMVSSSGDNIEQLLYSLYTKSDFVAKDVKWNNFGIDDFVTAINNSAYDPNNLEKDSNYYIGNGNVIMNGLSGNVELDHGIFKFSDVVFNTKRTAGSAALSYSIYNAKISLAAKALFSPPASMYKTPKPVAISFTLSDNITAPKKVVDLTEVQSFLKEKQSQVAQTINQ